MKLPSYTSMLKMGKEELEALKAPVRARQARKQGELEMDKIDENLLTLDAEIEEICSKHPLDYGKLIDKLDKQALLERRKNQFKTIIDQLFPLDESAPESAPEVAQEPTTTA